MALITPIEGSATIGSTEYSLPNASTTLTPQTADAVYQIMIDVSEMTATESYEITIYEKCRSADAQRVLTGETISGVQSKPLWTLPGLILAHGWDVTMRKIGGADRTFTWSIRGAA
jgi:hypothetical protein